MKENDIANLSKRDKEMIGLSSEIPEIAKAQIDQSEIPPPAPDVNLEEEITQYKKWAKQTWQEHLEAQEKSAVREGEGYQSPRSPDGSLNWDKVWQMQGLKPPDRNEVFPNGEDEDLDDKEVETKLNQYLEAHDIPLWSLSGIASDQFPEVIDRDIRELCREINNDNWIKTKEGCSGHREVTREDGTMVPADKGFRNPYLAFYLDRKDPRSEIMVEKVQKIIDQLKEKYGFVRGGMDEFDLNDQDLQDQDIRGVNFGLAIDPSPEWVEMVKQEKGENYFADVPKRPDQVENEIITVRPPRPDGFPDEDSFVRAYTEQYQVFNYQRALWHDYGDRYYDKYGDYFRSEQAQKISQEFFTGIGEIKEEIETGQEKSAKEIQWAAVQEKVDKITDGLALEIDDGIKESVTSLMAHNFPLDGSCEGHTDRGLPYPWVDVSLEFPEEKLKLRGEERDSYIKEMQEKHGVIQDRLQRLLDQFYGEHPSDNRFVFEPKGVFGAFRIVP